MALTNYERVKRWREKNRAIYNLRRRNARKNFPVTKGESSGALAGDAPKSGVISTVGQLKELIRVEESKRPDPVPVTVVYRSETGMVISKEQWEVREEEKRLAAEKGFVYDDYSQA